jgi:hypothetical protein
MNRLPFLVAIVALTSLSWAQTPTSSNNLVAGSAPQLRVPVRQDGRLIPRLRWVAPSGELPGTYDQYMRQHPLRPASFSNQRIITPPGEAAGPDRQETLSISILVDSDLYPTILPRLDEYAADLIAERHAVFMETVSGGAPEDIKAWVQTRYDAGSGGIVFVGDITAAWAEVSESVFPCDLFYMDLDGDWDDADTDGDYEIHQATPPGDEGPEVCVARIYAHTLTYDTEAGMVNGYFGKAHDYRGGSLVQPWRGLEYVDEDWYSMDVHLDLLYGDSVTRHDFGYFTTAADYLDQMDLGQHFVQVCAHSYSGGHHFGTRPTESAVYAHLYVHSPSTRAAKLLLGSDDGIKAWLNGDNVCTEDVYGGWTPDQFVIDVTLDEGWNQLLCKISQGGGDYQFSARFTDMSLVTFTDLTYQINDPDTHGQDAQFIRGWLLHGFHQDISDNFWSYLTTNYLGVDEASINPHEGDPTGIMTWTDHSAAGSYLDLDQYFGGVDFGASYAFARVYANDATSCQLWLGYDDGLRVWLNGQEVLYDNRYGGFEADMTKIDVTLDVGENRLLLKVSEWMGSYGFSARFCNSDGSPVDGLTYDPEPEPVSYIGTWLLNGPYANPDSGTRLSQDYLGGEAGARPSEGDSAPQGTWAQGMAGSSPFDLATFYDHGDWVYSQTIQDRDPPVLFYNLFSCGPGRFTDQDYLAGAYIFNTTYGLITVASAKSGSMLNFHDFTSPLGEGKTVGEAYRAWFDAQAPFELWEREWYYGMVLNGDPTLRPVRRGDLDVDGDVDPTDHAVFGECLAGPQESTPPPGCTTTQFNAADLDDDGDVDLSDFGEFAGLVAG